MSLTGNLKDRARYYRDRFDNFSRLRGDIDVMEAFTTAAAQIASPRVLELGTRRHFADRSTMHTHFVPHAGKYIGSDAFEGLDVDIVADVHTLAETVGAESFDIIISCSSFEHFKYPHLAAYQIMKTLRIGGLVFIQTHQTFPIHSAPDDYFRFSRGALESCFGSKMGVEVVATDYEFPARIRSRQYPSSKFMPSFLNTRMLAIKRDKTPDEYIYEL